MIWAIQKLRYGSQNWVKSVLFDFLYLVDQYFQHLMIWGEVLRYLSQQISKPDQIAHTIFQSSITVFCIQYKLFHYINQLSIHSKLNKQALQLLILIMFWLFLFVLALMATLYWAWKFGLLDKFSMEKGRLMSCEILYLPYKGDYHKLGPLFEQVSRNTQTVFKFSQNFGFYYDDPGTTAAQNCRAIVGIIVNEGEQFKMGQFCRNFEGYRRAHLETTRYISHEMPFVNMLSIVLMVKRVYPRIQEYLKKEDIKEQELFGMMEIYRCVSSQKKIEIAVPLNNKEQFFGLIEDRLRDDEQSHG